MPSIPHSFGAALTLYAAPIAAFLVALVLPLLGRGQAWVAATGGAALFVGWALLLPISLLPRVVWAPHRGVETLLAPALACAVSAALLAWRGSNRPRLEAVLLAVFTGWWVARDGVGTVDFWRVWFGVAALAGLIGRIAAGRADRMLVLALALWGGLTVAATGAVWQLAALVATACAAGLVGAGAGTAVPAAAIAALLGAADLAGGRLLRGHLDGTDLACIAALAAPFVADAASARLGRMSDRVAAVSSSVIGAAITVAAVWLLRRALLT